MNRKMGVRARPSFTGNSGAHLWRGGNTPMLANTGRSGQDSRNIEAFALQKPPMPITVICR